MRTRLLYGSTALAILFFTVLLLTSAPAAAEPPAARPVHMGLVRSMFHDAPEPLIRVTTNAFQSLVANQTGLASEVSVPGNAMELAELLTKGKLQLGVFHGFEFAWVRQKHPELRPLMVVVKQQPFVGAVLVVRTDSKIENVAALQGKTLALSRLARQHCRLFLERRCVAPDTTMDRFFGKVSSPRTDVEALDEVAEGQSHAAVVDDVELKSYRKTYPQTGSRLRVLQTSEVFPCTVVAYHAGSLDDETLRRLRTGMIAANTTERGRTLLGFFQMTGFEAVPADYEKSVAEILKAYPPPK